MKLARITAILLLAIVSGCSQAPPPESITQQPVLPSKPPERIPLVVFGAGSLIIPFDALEEAFENQYPNIDVLAEHHGSIQVIRHATELHESIDMVATADASLIPMLMYAQNDPATGKPYANWYIRFATNRLAIAHQPGSKYAKEITPQNWTTILARPDVRVGVADPRFDPSGYRALMVYALMQEVTGDYTLFREMFEGQFTTPITIFLDEDLATITVPEIVETQREAHVVIRGASIQLVALLESGDLDYAFEYESVIRQHNLQMVQLPDSVNLGAEDYDEIYSKVQVNLDFQRFSSVKPEFHGEPIGYGITIPSNAPHPREAALFIAYLLSETGRQVMKANYHPLFDEPICDGYENAPVELQSYCPPASVP